MKFLAVVVFLVTSTFAQDYGYDYGYGKRCKDVTKVVTKWAKRCEQVRKGKGRKKKRQPGD
ncbi:hypothetical protein K502DRAFT_351822 [Neoconidiobolus thromboides FSU 785]|nr:hypothetical protein K502DRAFT_351822 [Neoconidiobolus thromboides FSU 785]